MKKLFYFFLFIGIISSARAQKCTVKKGYAYFRTALPGAVPRARIDETGKEIEQPVKQMVTYFIYLESKPGRLIQPTRLWIDGKAFNVLAEPIKTTPIIIQHSHPGIPADTLVKQTKNNITRIQPKEALNIQPDAKLAKKIAGSKVVVEYTRNSRKFYHTIKDIKKLPPLVLQ